MNAVYIIPATVRAGWTTRNAKGEIIEEHPATCEYDQEAGSVIVGKLKVTDDSMEPDGPAEFVAGDWDAAGYLKKALELLEPRRHINIPDFREIVQNAKRMGDCDCICDYCHSCNCNDCIVTEWRDELEE